MRKAPETDKLELAGDGLIVRSALDVRLQPKRRQDAAC